MESSETAIPMAETNKSLLDAPPQYSAQEAQAWANGFNAATSRVNPPAPEPTEAEKREVLRKALIKDMWAKQGELSFVNAEYKALGQKRATLIAQVAAVQLNLTEINQEISVEALK